MNPLEALLRLHMPHVRQRGFDYAEQGLVTILSRNQKRIEARVMGSEEYRVQLTAHHKDWADRCTCPAWDQYDQCKHVCAVAYACLRADGVVTDEERLEEEVEVAFGAPGSERARTREPVAWARTDRRAPDPDVVERELLATLQRRMPVVPAPSGGKHRRLRYVITPLDGAPDMLALELSIARVEDRGPGPYRPLHEVPTPAHFDELDRLAIEVLLPGIRHAGGHDHTLAPELQRLLLPRCAEQSRLWLRAAPRGLETPLVVDAGAPARFELVVRESAAGFELDGRLVRESGALALRDVDAVFAGGFAASRGVLFAVEWHGAHAWAATLRARGPTWISRARRNEVLTLIARSVGHVPIDAEGFVRDVGGTPRPVLVLGAPEEGYECVNGAIEFEYEGRRFRRGGPRVIVADGTLYRSARDEAAEKRFETAFVEAGGRLLTPKRGADAGVRVVDERLGPVVRTLLGAGWIVEGEGRRVRDDGEFGTIVGSGVDWFDLEAEIVFDGATGDFPALLAALEENRPFVRLSDGSLGLVPEEWLARWRKLLELGEVEDGALRVDRNRGLLLDALLEERGVRIDDAAFAELRTRLRGASAPAATEPPSGFRGTLRDYQKEGLGWLASLGDAGLGGCLADDMGLGKTVQVLALILARRAKARGPALVVAPRSLVFNWEREAARFTPALKVHVHHGARRKGERARLGGADLVLTTYSTARIDAKELATLAFDLVVLDEAQAIKNARSQSAKAVRLLRADQRLALTGTPIENKVEDLLSIFEFLNPGLLGASRTLRKLFDTESELESARFAARTLRPFLLRRTKEEVLTELPPKTEQTVTCELEGDQKREYAALRDHYRRTLLATVDEVGIAKAGLNVIEALLRLRQAACHLALIDKQHVRTQSAKLDVLLDLLEEVVEAGHKALVFSQFTSFLALVKKALDARKIAYEYLDGQTSDRETRVKRFQEKDDARVFLVSLKAGGVGLNLTAADYVFLLDPWWNPAVERQAIDRTHRIGQTRAVTAYRLVARDTVEEKVLALQEKKRALADALFEGQGSALRELTREDLESILS